MHKCSCGSRWFAKSQVVVTCGDGRSFSFGPSVSALVCVGCGNRWLWDASRTGKKELVMMNSAIIDRLESMTEEEHSWRNRDGELYHRVGEGLA